jgi:hypothetical protein
VRRSGRWRGSFATDCRAASFGSRERMLHSRVPYVRRMRAIPNRLTATAGQILERSLTTAHGTKVPLCEAGFRYRLSR